MTDNPYPAPIVPDVPIGKRGQTFAVTVRGVWHDDAVPAGRGGRTVYAFELGPQDRDDDDTPPVTLNGVDHAGWAWVYVPDDARHPTMADLSVRRWPVAPFSLGQEPTANASQAFYRALVELADRLHNAPDPDRVNGNGSPDAVVRMAARLRTVRGSRDARERAIADAREAYRVAVAARDDAAGEATRLANALGGAWLDAFTADASPWLEGGAPPLSAESREAVGR